MDELIYPVFYGHSYGEGNIIEKLTGKHIYIVQPDSSNTRMKGITREDGRLYSGNHRIPLRVGISYFFYVSETDIKNFNYSKLTSGYYSNTIKVERKENLDIRQGKYNIGNQSIIAGNQDSGKPMYVRVYGKGSQKKEWSISGTRRAIFFIGGLHRNEEGGITAIKIMEEYVQQRRNAISLALDIPEDTTVFVLNPVHSPNLVNSDDGHRDIFSNTHNKKIDPNREFSDLNLPETQNIDKFIRTLLAPGNYNSLIIISGHRYRSNWDSNNWRKRADETFPGVVMPLFQLNLDGVPEERILEAYNEDRSGKTRYTVPRVSERLAVDEKIGFKTCTGFDYETAWHRRVNGDTAAEIYEKEFMGYLNKYFENDIGSRINMLEFEIPFSVEKPVNTVSQWTDRFNNFVSYLLTIFP